MTKETEDRINLAKECAKRVAEDYRQRFIQEATSKKHNVFAKLVPTINAALGANRVIMQEGAIVATVPDHHVRLDAVKIAGDWFGLKPDEKHVVDANITIEVVKFNNGKDKAAR
jgi:hypothetical protein